MAGVQTIDVQSVQGDWMGEWHRYIVGRFFRGPGTALEVGSGAGSVMSNIASMLDVKGIDIDPEQVRTARGRGLDVDRMDGLELDLKDGSFDIVFCSFYLMWVKDTRKAIEEMLRVSRKGVLILNEPIWSRSMYAPDGLKELVDGWTSVIRKDGGDPDAGLKVAEIVGQMGGRFGTVPIEMDKTELERNVVFEYDQLNIRGVNYKAVVPTIFHVPFIWGFVPKGRAK
ncbi:MAG: class I SAM-dependent methyltransferase [Candidatus Thermoplasmatota archaeon]|nr:class I SAM-dependent methyltransferase [Candidatus Thermoplasmatota archaeon]